MDDLSVNRDDIWHGCRVGFSCAVNVSVRSFFTMVPIICQPRVTVVRCLRARTRPAPAARQLQSSTLTSLSNRAPVQHRSMKMNATTDVGIQELEGLCMASLQGLGYSRDEASILTEVRTVASMLKTENPHYFRPFHAPICVAVWGWLCLSVHWHEAVCSSTPAPPSPDHMSSRL